MKRFLLAPLFATSTLAHAQIKADEAQIKSIVNEFMIYDASTKTFDFSKLLARSTEDASWVNIVGMYWGGRETMGRALNGMFNQRNMFKDVKFERKSTTIRFVTPDVAIAKVVSHVGEFYPPDGVNRGTNVVPASDEMGTMVFVKKGGKWFFTAGQNTIIDARAAADNPIQAAAKE
ncbi:SgcJ/EcaC family oxidoreductase [Hymenobacter sp.]|jgi:uncharacterized protein (TIGR02246 family)|uniref:SgcJ/EcaC family oxidoreductase n=1 Tax=Hymenobacter sp. TaxID=1898978 RepID=UPI002EDB0007